LVPKSVNCSLKILLVDQPRRLLPGQGIYSTLMILWTQLQRSIFCYLVLGCCIHIIPGLCKPTYTFRNARLSWGLWERDVASFQWHKDVARPSISSRSTSGWVSVFCQRAITGVFGSLLYPRMVFPWLSGCWEWSMHSVALLNELMWVTFIISCTILKCSIGRIYYQRRTRNHPDFDICMVIWRYVINEWDWLWTHWCVRSRSSYLTDVNLSV
jgi:hypothetical protein